MNSDRRERVFLVRLWQERDSGVPAPWRGSIHDVRTGRKRYISEPQEIADFVALRLSATDDVASDAPGHGNDDDEEQR